MATIGLYIRLVTVTVLMVATAALLVRPVHGVSPPALEPGEDKPGGAATSRASTDNRNAFSQFSGNMSFSQEFDFKIGNAIFRKTWVSAPSSTKSSDGLGPLYNARSCQGCHLKDGRGHPPSANWPEDTAVSMFLRLSIPPETEEQRQALSSGRVNVIGEPTYGGQLQNFAIQGHRGEGQMHIDYVDVRVSLNGGEIVTLRKPTYSVKELGYGPMHPKVMLSPRVAPPMIGLGLIEAIPEQDIVAKEDPDDKDGDGISGRAQRVWSLENKSVALGRFGWKGGTPSVAQQSAEAFAGDIGIATSLVPRLSGDCTAVQSQCVNAPNGGDKNGRELADSMFRLVVFYSQNLAVPARRNANSADVLAGKQIFHEIGCASCHHPSYRTGASPGSPHLANQLIWPYTDLLLHDMGDELADNRPEGRATGHEWKTAPLWGVGLTETVSGHSYLLHDGRARNVKEAILWHGGEAKAARDRFSNLPQADRERLIAFVNSL